MTIKIPQDIREVLDSNDGHEPTAFIDIYEERGDFDVVDTQNQLKAANDPAVVNDINMDFDRKPGFAILAPGKHVDSVSTAIQGGWGSANIDLTQLGSLKYFRLRSLHSIGNNVVVGFANYSTVSIAAQLTKIAQLTSTDGGDTYVATDLGLPANNFLGVPDIGFPNRVDRSTVFDNLVLCDNNGHLVEYANGDPTPIIHNIGANGVNGGNIAAKINGIYFVGQPWAGGSTKIFYSDSPDMAIKYSVFTDAAPYIYTIGNHVYIASGSSHIRSLITGSASSISWTAFTTILMFNERIALRNGNVIGTFKPNNITHDFECLVSSDGGFTVSTVTIATRKNTNSQIRLVAYQSNGDDQSYAIILGESDPSGEKFSIYKTSNGTSWTEYYDKVVAPSNIYELNMHLAVTATAEGHVTAVSADPDTTIPMQALSFTDNSTTGVGVTDSFEYNVVVSDEYIIDQGKGKK